MATGKIPAGFHTITPHLSVKGAAQAIEFYKKAFGARELFRHPGAGGKIMHATLQIGNSRLMLADEFPEFGEGCHKSAQTLGGSPVTLALYVEDVDAAFNQAVAAGAKPTVPLADQFWGSRYGQVEDPFGHSWSISTQIKEMTEAELEEAGRNFFASLAP